MNDQAGSDPQSTPFLSRLTGGQRSTAWLRRMALTILLLWIASIGLIWFQILLGLITLGFPNALIALVWLPLFVIFSILAPAVFAFVTAHLISIEAQSEQIDLLRLTNVPASTIFDSVVLGSLYRVRGWLVWLIGLFPYLISFGSRSYEVWFLPDDLRTYRTLLGGVYIARDGPPDMMRQIEIIWFLCLTIAILALWLAAILITARLALKSRGTTYPAVIALSIIVPVILGLIMLIMPEGFLALDLAYGAAERAIAIGQVIPAGLAIAAVSLAALTILWRLFRVTSLR